MGNFVFMVPQQTVYILETLGKYSKTLQPGLRFTVPLFQRIAYIHNLKEQSCVLQEQQAITKDNVFIKIDAVAYLKVNDPYKASYGAEDPMSYAQQLAQSIMRSEIGKLSLDSTFESREILNANILEQLQKATQQWGISCQRYEIKDIKMSESIRKVMNLQAESERQKRAFILQSEGKKQELINEAFADKQRSILEAQGEGENLLLNGQAVSQRIKQINDVIQSNGLEAVKFQLAQSYIDSLSALKGKQLVIKADINNPSEMIKRGKDLVQ